MTNSVPEKHHAQPGKERLRLWLGLLRSTRHVESVLRARLRQQFSMTLSQFDVMAALRRSGGGLIMTEVSAALMVSNGNVTGIVDRLVDEGLVIRSMRNGDRRTSVVRLTPKGQRRFDRMAEKHEEWVNELLGGLEQGAVGEMTDALCRIRKQEDQVKKS